MTKMRRVTISFDKQTESAVETIRKQQPRPCSYSDAVRQLIVKGYEALREKAEAEE